MWFVIIDDQGYKRYINSNHIVYFYFDGKFTVLWLANSGMIRTNKDITKQLLDTVRAAGSAIKFMGE